MLNKHNLNVAQFASKEESRYTMRAIRVEPGATVATNGYYLAWCSTDSVSSENYPVVPNFAGAQDTFEPFLLDAKSALDIAKVTPTKSHIPVLNHVAVNVAPNVANGELQGTFAVTDLERPQVFTPKPVSGKFPAYDAVMPKWEDAKFRVALDADYLAKIAKAFGGFVEGRTSKKVVLSFYAEDKSVRFDGTCDGQGMTVVLMPIRGTEDQSGTYGWKDREAKREQDREAEAAKAKAEANADVQEDADAKAEHAEAE